MSVHNDLSTGINEIERAQAQSVRELREAQLTLPSLLSGEAMFRALQAALDDLKRSAPQFHDILIQVDNLTVTEISFIEPYTFLLQGLDEKGHDPAIARVCHFSQLNVKVISRPQHGKDRLVSRVIQGFAPTTET